MKTINENGEIFNYELTNPFWDKKPKKVEYEFQALGIEMSEKIKNPWFLFHRYPLVKIREAWKVCQQKEIYTLPYLIGIIKKIQ